MSRLLEDESMGLYYISEISNEGENTIEDLDVVDEGHGIFYVKYMQTLQSFDVMNRNQRHYDGDNVWDCIVNSEKIQSQIRHNGWFMELDHPMQIYKDKPLTPERIQNPSYDRRCAIIKKPFRTSNLLRSPIVTTCNDLGEGLAKDIIAHKYQPMASLRAIANLINKGGKPYVWVKKVITYDTVNYASHREADSDMNTMRTVTKAINAGPLTESTVIERPSLDNYDMLIPLKDILEMVGKTDVNAQIIMESFEIDTKELVGFNQNRTQMIMKDGTNTIYANISPESTRKVNDFFASF